jgi:ferredoxin/flavodoxin---NADP+ reductase
MWKEKNVFKILETREMAQGTVFRFTVVAPLIARKALPGQFVLLRVNDTGERMPLTVADRDPAAGTITLIFQVVGKTTALMSTLKAGEFLADVVGPLGKPTHIERLGTVVCVGGGTGIAVLYPITRAFKESGNHVISVLGARSKGLLILEEEMRTVSHELLITTDDGSYGEHGFVTDVLRRLLTERSDIKLITATGPVPMMKSVSRLARESNVPSMASLNSIMVDGTGMCGACRVTVAGKTKFACVDGPEFDGAHIDYDELIQRQRAYLTEEQASMKSFTLNAKKGAGNV